MRWQGEEARLVPRWPRTRRLAQFHELSMEQNVLFHQGERIQPIDTCCKREVECYAYPYAARGAMLFSKTGYGEPADKTTA